MEKFSKRKIFRSLQAVLNKTPCFLKGVKIGGAIT